MTFLSQSSTKMYVSFHIQGGCRSLNFVASPDFDRAAAASLTLATTSCAVALSCAFRHGANGSTNPARSAKIQRLFIRAPQRRSDTKGNRIRSKAIQSTVVLLAVQCAEKQVVQSISGRGFPGRRVSLCDDAGLEQIPQVLVVDLMMELHFCRFHYRAQQPWATIGGGLL